LCFGLGRLWPVGLDRSGLVNISAKPDIRLTVYTEYRPSSKPGEVVEHFPAAAASMLVDVVLWSVVTRPLASASTVTEWSPLIVELDDIR